MGQCDIWYVSSASLVFIQVSIKLQAQRYFPLYVPATRCNTLQIKLLAQQHSSLSDLLQLAETYCNTLTHTCIKLLAQHRALSFSATWCKTLQHTTTHCNKLQSNCWRSSISPSDFQCVVSPPVKYTCMYVYICIYKYTHTYKYIYKYMNICTYKYVCIHTYIYICIYVYTWIYTYIDIYIYVCVYIYMYISLYTYTYICLYI